MSHQTRTLGAVPRMGGDRSHLTHRADTDGNVGASGTDVLRATDVRPLVTILAGGACVLREPSRTGVPVASTAPSSTLRPEDPR